MTSSSAPGAHLPVLIVCAPEDAPAVRALAQRLRADGMSPALASEALTPRALRTALGTAAAVVCCLSRRAMPSGQLIPMVANVLELLAATPDPQRLTIALRLTSCEAPAPLRQAIALDLFSVSGYERLLSALRDHAAALAPPQPPEPIEPDLPTPPAIPALELRGGFELPSLERQGLARRLGRGVARAVFMVDGQHALVVSGGGPALTPLAGGPPLWAIDCPTRCAALSPSGRLLALAAGSQIFVWDLAAGSLRSICEGHTSVVSGLAFAPDERTLASASHDRSVRLWRIGDDGHPPSLLATLPDHSDQATSVAFSPDGALIASGGADRTVRVWRSLDRSRVQTLAGHGGAVEALAFSPDGATLAAGSRGRRASLWDTHTWRLTHSLESHEGAVEALAFRPDSALVATGAADHKVRLWRRADGALQRALSDHAGPVTSLAFSPDGATLVSVAEDERLMAWQTADGTHSAALRPLSGRVTSLALSPGGTHLAVGSSSGSLTVYDLDDESRARLRQNEHRSSVISVAFTGPGRLVSAASDRTIRVCETESGQSSIMLQTHGALQSACLAPGGQLLASSDSEATVQLWRLSQPGETPGGSFWRVLRGLRGRPRLIAFDPRAETVAVTSDEGAVYLWRLVDLAGDGADPALTLAFADGQARSLTFSADGALIAVGGDGGAVQVWRTSNGVEVGSLPGAGRAATSLAFAADSRALAAGDTGGTIRIWRTGAAEVRRRPPTTLLAHAGAVDHLAYGSGGLLVSGSADGTARVWRV